MKMPVVLQLVKKIKKRKIIFNSYSDVYRRNYIKLKAVLGGTKEQTEKALEVLGEYDDAKSGAENKLGGCMERFLLK